MSSDEEVVLTGRQKRSASLAKRGRNRISTLADDDDYDDGVFEPAAANDDSEEENPRYKEVDVTFSASNLKKALQKLQLKGCLDPDLDDAFEAKTWSDMEKEIESKNIKLQELETLVKYVNKADNLSLEYKCLVISIARQTCINAKKKDDTKKAQVLFKSKDKGNKSNHVANFVTNTWFWESFSQLQKIGALENAGTSDNMHIVLVECSLKFMRDSFVIDSEKKVNVLKEKQQIDWAKAVQRSIKLATANNITSMGNEASLTKKHFQAFREVSKPADPGAGDQNKSSTPATVEPTSVQDMAKKKRTERLQNLRRRVSATSLQNSTSAPASTTPASTPAPAPAPAPTKTNRNLLPPARKTSDLISSMGGAKPLASSNTNSQKDGGSSSGWGKPRNTGSKPSWGQPPQQERPRNWSEAAAPAPPSEQSNVPAADPSASIPPTIQQENLNGATTVPSAPAPAPQTSRPAWGQPPPVALADNDPPGRRGGDSVSARGRPSDDRQPRSWEGPTAAASPRDDYDYSRNRSGSSGYGYSQNRYEQRDFSHQTTYSSLSDRAQTNSTSVVGDSGSAETPGRAWGDSAPVSSGYSAGSSHDNQTDASVGYDHSRRYNNNDYASNREGSSLPQSSYSKRARDSDFDRRPERNEEKRYRYDAPSSNPDPYQNSSSSMGRGRGRGRTLPAWMTQNGDGPSSADASYSSLSGAHHASDYPSRELPHDSQPQRAYASILDNPPAPSGNGRGRGRTLPAWMTHQDSNGPHERQPAASSNGGAPSGTYRDMLSYSGGFSEPSRDGPGTLQGTGRGRGRTLPAWMTNQK